MLVEELGGDQLQHGIAEILEALVVTRRKVRALVRERAVGDGLQEQGGVAEMNPYLLLELL